jgi:gamma-glutamylaminecyclotransferase
MSLLLSSERIILDLVDWLKYDRRDQHCEHDKLYKHDNITMITIFAFCGVFDLVSVCPHELLNVVPAHIQPHTSALTHSHSRAHAHVRWSVASRARYGEPEQIVLRRWEPRLKLENEFRCFVHDGKLVAMSQYDHYCVYPSLFAQVADIEHAVRELWQEMHPHVGVRSYCFDVAYLADEKRAVLVELSPYLPCTGPACFSWTRDRSLLLGEADFEFRLNRNVRPQIRELVECNWEHRFKRQSVPPFDRAWEDILRRDRTASARSRGCACVALAAVGYGVARCFLSHPAAASIGMACAGLPWAVNACLSRPHTRSILFVYGTLRRGYHWHDKFLSRGRFIGAATTCEPLHLVIGTSGVPYVLGDIGTTDGAARIRGECYEVDSFMLSDLDSYEGLSKGYYERRRISVRIESGSTAAAWIYMKRASDAELRSQPRMREYTEEMHAAWYQPIRHILVKQLLYLNGEFGTWGVPNSGTFDQMYVGHCVD